MVKIHANKKYDTSTATLLYDAQKSDYYYLPLFELYRKVSGEYFAFVFDLEDIVLVTFESEADAQCFAETRMSGEDYIRIWGDVEE